MHPILLWKTARGGRMETRHFIGSLDDLRDLLDAEGRGRTFYLEARPADDTDSVLAYHLRSSAEDVTEDDLRWLAAPSPGEVRGVRA